jgi:hypothetical protein
MTSHQLAWLRRFANPYWKLLKVGRVSMGVSWRCTSTGEYHLSPRLRVLDAILEAGYAEWALNWDTGATARYGLVLVVTAAGHVRLAEQCIADKN